MKGSLGDASGVQPARTQRGQSRVRVGLGLEEEIENQQQGSYSAPGWGVWSIAFRSPASGAKLPRFTPCLCHLAAVLLVTYPVPPFLFYKKSLKIVSASWGCFVKIKCLHVSHSEEC